MAALAAQALGVAQAESAECKEPLTPVEASRRAAVEPAARQGVVAEQAWQPAEEARRRGAAPDLVAVESAAVPPAAVAWEAEP